MSDSTVHAGLFPLSYRIGTGKEGAKLLTLNLLISTPRSIVTGNAAITQATNPPVDIHADVWGEFTYMTVMRPAASKILVTAQGNHGGAHADSIINFKLHLVVSDDWKEGVASYQYYDGRSWIDVSNAPAHLAEAATAKGLPPLEPGPVLWPLPPILPLYAAPIQHAIASGDLAQMKSLAVLAQKQLDQQQQLQGALDAAKHEISRLEHR